MLAAGLLCGAGSGCTMCPNPFDYSGPVPNGSAPQNDFAARSNGILPLRASPQPWPPIVQAVPKGVPTPAGEEIVSDVKAPLEASPEMASQPPAADQNVLR